MAYYSSSCFNNMIKKVNNILSAQCCTLLKSIANMYFHEHWKQLFCCGYKSLCFLDILGVNSQEAYKNNNQFVHWFEFVHVSIDLPGVFEWCLGEITEGTRNSLSCDLWASDVGWQKSKKDLSTVALAPELQGCVLSTSLCWVLCLA